MQKKESLVDQKVIPRITPRTVITLVPVQIQKEGNEYIVGKSGGKFILLPEVGKRALELLQEGLSLEEIEARLEKEYEEEVEVQDFIFTLAEEGFITSIDGYSLPSPSRIPVSFPTLAKQHVGWILSRPALIIYGIVLFLGASLSLTHWEMLPSWRDFFWSSSPSLVLLGNLAIGIICVSLHELAHLLTARAYGVNGFIRFGTRLHMLVLQTDVSGVWAISKRYRYAVYLSGMILNLLLMSFAVILLVSVAHGTVHQKFSSVIILTNFFIILGEFELYTRTDVYFVLQDLLRCKNLFHDGMSYAKYILSRILPQWFHEENPLPQLPLHEQKSVKLYTVIAVLGSFFALGSFLLLGIPILIKTYLISLQTMIEGMRQHTLIKVLDGLLPLTVSLSFFIIYLRTFARTHQGIMMKGKTVLAKLVR